MKTSMHAVALAAALALAATGCTYRLEGKVVEGFGSVAVGRGSDPDASRPGVPGATVELVRDAGTSRRAVAARASSGPDGRFTLEVEGFGAGWMEERWQLRARRAGFENVESELLLPGSPAGRMAIVSMHRGRSRPFQEPDTARSIMDEAKAWETGTGRP